MKKQDHGLRYIGPGDCVLGPPGHDLPNELMRAARAKDKGIGYWYTHVKSEVWIGFTAALDNYIAKRGNGEARDKPKNAAGETIDFPVGGKFDDWKNPKDGYWYLRYTEGSNDKVWMEERDRNYILRLEREGRLLDVEPNADTEIVVDHKFRQEIVDAMKRARAAVAGLPWYKRRFDAEAREEAIRQAHARFASSSGAAAAAETTPTSSAKEKQVEQQQAERKAQEAAEEVKRQEAERKANEQAEKARLEAESQAKAAEEQQERVRQEQLRLEEQHRKAEEEKQREEAERLAEQQRSEAEAKRVAEQQRLLQEQQAKLTTNLQELQIEPAKLQGLLQKVSALPTTAGYELADIQHLTAITGRLSQELAAQQTAITAVEHEVGLDPVTRAELDCIQANKNLSGFYQMLRKTLSDAVIAAKSISSGWGGISDDKLDDALMGVEVIGEQFPGIALVVKVLTKSAKLAYKQHKKTMMGHLAEVSPDVTSFERAAELFARQLTMENKEWLSRYDELGEQGLWARMQNVKEQVSDACREFIRGRALSRAEKLGIEAGTTVLALIMGGKVPAWQTAENFAQQLLCLWIGEDFSYKSPFTGKVAQETRVTVAPAPVIVAEAAGAAVGGGSYGQVGVALRSPSPINQADREHVAKLEDELAEEKRKRLQTEQQMRQMMEQLQTLKTNSQGAASQQQLTALQHQLKTLQSKIKPLITKQPDAAASALGLDRSDGRRVQLSAVDLKEHNEKARVISLEHEELKEQVGALLSMVSALMHQQSQQENELERLRQSRAPRA